MMIISQSSEIKTIKGYVVVRVQYLRGHSVNSTHIAHLSNCIDSKKSAIRIAKGDALSLGVIFNPTLIFHTLMRNLEDFPIGKQYKKKAKKTCYMWYLIPIYGYVKYAHIRQPKMITGTHPHRI